MGLVKYTLKQEINHPPAWDIIRDIIPGKEGWGVKVTDFKKHGFPCFSDLLFYWLCAFFKLHCVSIQLRAGAGIIID